MKFKQLPLAIMMLGVGVGSAYAQSNNAKTGTFDTYISAGLGIGGTNFGNSASNPQTSGFAGEARFSGSYTDNSGFGGQVDVVYNSQMMNNLFVNKVNTTDLDVAGHLFYRNDNLLGGAFIQRTTANLSYGAMTASAPLGNTNYYGLEGQAYLGNFTLYGQAGAQTMQVIYDGKGITGPVGTVEARYFINDNFRVGAAYSYSGLSNNDFLGANFKSSSNGFNIGTEYRFDNSPISVFAQYDYFNQSNPTYYQTSSNSSRGLLGIKFSFGSGTLLQRDRSGSTLNPVRKGISVLNIVG